jgi:hypothetical protein
MPQSDVQKVMKTEQKRPSFALLFLKNNSFKIRLNVICHLCQYSTMEVELNG